MEERKYGTFEVKVLLMLCSPRGRAYSVSKTKVLINTDGFDFIMTVCFKE